MRHLRGLPAALVLHAHVAWFVADIAREGLSNLIHHRKPPWPDERNTPCE